MDYDDYDNNYDDDNNEYDSDEESYNLDDEDEEGKEQEEEPEEIKKAPSILSALTKGKKNMYFDEELVKDLIVNQYQPFLDYGVNEKGKKVCTCRDRASKDVEKEIMGNLLLIANAIINKYRYWRFEPVDDLQAEALKAMWYYLPNFVPGKGSAFDLFSIICKRHLLNFTLKNYKHRIASDIDSCYDVANPEAVDYNILFDNIEKTFLSIINKHYIGAKRKKYIELTSILMEYLVKNNKIVGKNDLLSAFKEYGYKSTEYKKFIEEISKYKEELYEVVK